MAIVQLSSSNGSAGGDGKASSGGSGASSSVSSSALERPDQVGESSLMSESFGGERVINGVSLNRDFFFVRTYLFNQMFIRVPFTAFQSTVL